MYKSWGVLVVLFLLLNSNKIFAEEEQGVYLGLGMNSIYFTDDNVLEDATDFYLLLGYQITEHWGVELETTEIQTQLSPASLIDFDTRLSSINAKYRYNSPSNDSFFWKVGIGEYGDLPLTTDTGVAKFGMGYEWASGKGFNLHLGTDAILNTDETNWDTKVYFGGVYYFGGGSSASPKPAPKPLPKPNPAVDKPKDSDNDGVIDSMDQCPSTKVGVKVDNQGCELDLDGDGVKDSLDQCPQTPSGAKVDQTGCRVILEKDVSITLNVKFANNSDAITDTYRSEIQQVADFMRQYPDTTVVIEGHTDDRGAASYNQQLSEKRAKAVMQYLIDNFQIDSKRLSAVGVGEVSPIATNDTADGRAQNRRVQAEIKTRVKEAQ